MGATEDIDVIRRGYAAFSAGDVATLDELFTDDAVWHVPGTGSLSGSKQGKDAILVAEARQFFEDTALNDAFWD